MPNTPCAGRTREGKIVIGEILYYENGCPFVKVKDQDDPVFLSSYVEVGASHTTKIRPKDTGKVVFFFISPKGDIMAAIELNYKHRTRHIKVSEMLK